MDLEKLLSAVPEAAKTPTSLVAYAFAVGAWLLVAMRVKRHRLLLQHLSALPQKDRLEALKSEMGMPKLAKEMSPEQYLRGRIHTYMVVAYVITAALAAVIVITTLINAGEVSGTVQ